MHLLPLISPHPSGSDLRCDHHQREWILDLILEDIVLVLDAQDVDDGYESDASCEFGAPDPYEEFIANPFFEGSPEDYAALEAAQRHPSGRAWSPGRRLGHEPGRSGGRSLDPNNASDYATLERLSVVLAHRLPDHRLLDVMATDLDALAALEVRPPFRIDIRSPPRPALRRPPARRLERMSSSST